MTNTTEEKVVSAEEIKAAALRIFTHDEIKNLSRIPFRSFLILIEKRLREDGPQPTDDELDGLRELAFEHLWHSTFDRHTQSRSQGDW